eukprot:2842602-Rhodomonas_salina.1
MQERIGRDEDQTTMTLDDNGDGSGYDVYDSYDLKSTTAMTLVDGCGAWRQMWCSVGDDYDA